MAEKERAHERALAEKDALLLDKDEEMLKLRKKILEFKTEARLSDPPEKDEDGYAQENYNLHLENMELRGQVKDQTRKIQELQQQ